MHRSSLKQMLSSVRVDAGTTTQCSDCHTELGECDLVTLRLRHSDHSPTPDLRTCYCLGCAPTSFDKLSTTPYAEILVEARLGITQDSHRQATWLIPVSPTIIDTIGSTRLLDRAGQEQEVHE